MGSQSMDDDTTKGVLSVIARRPLNKAHDERSSLVGQNGSLRKCATAKAAGTVGIVTVARPPGGTGGGYLRERNENVRGGIEAGKASPAPS